MDIKIIIAAHKRYQMPLDSCYLPLQVGRQGKPDIGYQGDNTGENISEKNPYYCELTGMYWMWKNVKADYYGLVHYRRHFTAVPLLKRWHKERFSLILTKKQAKKLLKKYDVVLPKQRNYVIETVYTHYAHTHYGEHLDIAREILEKRFSEYLASFDTVMGQRRCHMFNMFLMKKDLFFQYCEWLFPILEELEQRVDPSQYDAFQARFAGRISEILLNVWILQNRIRYQEIPVLNMEKVNWKRKIGSFLRAKFLSKRYDSSF